MASGAAVQERRTDVQSEALELHLQRATKNQRTALHRESEATKKN